MNYEDATQDNTIHVWNSSTGQTLLTMHISVNDVAWSPDGTRIALIGVANTNFGTEIRDATTGQELLAYPTKQVSALAWSPDGKTVALGSGYGTADGIIQEWDATEPHLLFTFPKGFETDFNALSWSPDGKYIVSGGEHGIIDIWNAATGQHLLEALASFNIVFGVAWSPNNHYVLSWGGQAVDIWQTPMNVSG